MNSEKKPRGWAAMSPEVRREVCRKGGLAVSKNRAHMAAIGSRGGKIISSDSKWMSEIGAKGGASSRRRSPRKKKK